jgi:hypothetical protein
LYEWVLLRFWNLLGLYKWVLLRFWNSLGLYKWVLLREAIPQENPFIDPASLRRTHS